MDRETLAHIDENMICFDGLGEAIIGHGFCFQSHKDIAVYDYYKIIQIFMKDHEMSYDEAVEFIAFNVIGLYAGDQTPIVVVTDRPEEFGY